VVLATEMAIFRNTKNFSKPATASGTARGSHHKTTEVNALTGSDSMSTGANRLLRRRQCMEQADEATSTERVS
jgi:hypothetical protein